MSTRRLIALRGATSVATNEGAAIVDATTELLGELVGRNGVRAEDLVSIVFTATSDLDAAFPAIAARRLGLGDVPLLCAAEIAVPDAPERIVRVLVHLYSQRAADDLEHVYLGDARRLRDDPPRETSR